MNHEELPFNSQLITHLNILDRDNNKPSSCLCSFTGSAGQSFAVFLTPGMNIRLVGEANDYVGKV